MAKRGRKSEAELSLKVVSPKFGGKQSPPDDLSVRQLEIWRQVVSTEPPDHFATEALRGILSDYCRHRESAEALSGVINTFQPEWLKAEDGAKRYEKLLKMRDLETKAVMRCATKLRMTNQARYTPQAAGTAARNKSSLPKPWEL
jgi:hypothetical protein